LVEPVRDRGELAHYRELLGAIERAGIGEPLYCEFFTRVGQLCGRPVAP
jgi:hypothetical protein